MDTGELASPKPSRCFQPPPSKPTTHLGMELLGRPSGTGGMKENDCLWAPDPCLATRAASCGFWTKLLVEVVTLPTGDAYREVDCT